MRLTFLEADVPLSKAYERDANGRLTKKSYPAVWQFTSHTEDVETLAEFAARSAEHAALGHCLLKGNTARPLLKESRAGSTDANAPTEWMCLDIDRFDGTLERAIALLDAEGVDYVVQYSSAYGIETERGLTCHLFFRLAESQLPAALKLWLMWRNLTIPALAAQLQLTKTNTALSWPLDITTCQNDKLLYIAPPALKGIVDPIGERIVHVPGARPYFDLGLQDMPPAAQIKALAEAKINDLRQAKGLNARKFAYKIDKTTGLEVLTKCDAATMTGLRRERGFVYFNLNGGDSWGYWHPEENPSVIRNFKGEPDYLTAELLPEYWGTIERVRKEDDIAAALDKKETREAIQTGTSDSKVLVFRDFDTGIYYNGTWDGSDLVLAPAKSETQIQHFLKERGLPEIDFIPIWDVVFDPLSDVRVDFSLKRVNMWAPSSYMKQPVSVVEPSFPVITRIISHAVARDAAVREHFLNWLACVWQYRLPTLVAWILHGIQGTGKGLLIHKILKPLFGSQYVTVKRMEELEESFNAYLEHSVLVSVDEAQISDSKRSKMIMANLKNQITEPELSVRRMYSQARTVKNHTNWLFCSNTPDPVMIDATDRRFNVGEFRQEKLEITDEEIEAIEAELPHFAQYLTTRVADRAVARTVLASAERDRIIATSRTSAELVAEALAKGQLELFWEELPSGATDLLPISQQLMVQEYTNLVHRAVVDGKNRFTRDELRVLFEYLCGDMPRTPTKFTQLLRHRNLHTEVMRIDGRPVRGLEVTWTVSPEWLAARKLELTPKLKEVA